MEHIVKDCNANDKISSFAFGVGKKLEELVLKEWEFTYNAKRRLEAKTFIFRRILQEYGTELVDASEVLKLYESTFEITEIKGDGTRNSSR